MFRFIEKLLDFVFMGYFMMLAIPIGIMFIVFLIKKMITHARTEKARKLYEEHQKIVALQEAEQRRKREEERAERERAYNRIWNSSCNFTDGITESEFTRIANDAARVVSRVQILVQGPIVYGKVISQSGISEWSFRLSFNDGGHITGSYYRETENTDSQIPERIGSIISYEIGKRRRTIKS